jgi:hypothetical protein
MNLEERVKALEWQNKLMKILFAVVVLVAAGVAAAPNTQSSLLLESPNKQYKVLIKATDTTAGIWVSGDPSGSMSTLVSDEKSGSVVGVYGPKVDGKDWTSMDAALTANGNHGGYIMLSNPDRSDHKFITGK